jgi:hypothetical protein
MRFTRGISGKGWSLPDAITGHATRGWVNYYRVGHSSRCFSMVKQWVKKKIRRHLMRARGRKGFGWNCGGV